MKILVAGATGALGVPVVRQLVANGHEVAGLTRSIARKRIITELGAHPVVGNALDEGSLHSVVASVAPEAIVHALTAIPKRGPLRPSDLKPTNELRVHGTRNLLKAAIATGVRRIVLESMVFIYGYGDLGSEMLTEESSPAQAMPKAWLRPPVQALVDSETQVREATRLGHIEGIVLRFGGFYGPGAGIETMIRLLRKRWLPLPKTGSAATVSWIHIHDAASAVVAALDRGRAGEIYNSVDDHPASFSDFVRHLAAVIGAPRPPFIPMWLLRLLAPFMVAALLKTSMRVSNRKAERELNWTPGFPSYRDGLVALGRSIGVAPDR